MFCNVLAAWFVILVNELNNGTFSINGSKNVFTLTHIRHWFITYHSSRTKPHKTKNHKKWTTISGNHNLLITTSGNKETILPTHLKISHNSQPIITKNNTVGKIANNHVKKWLLILLFSLFKDFLFILSQFHII